jgi:hypothetical protein
MEFYCKQKLNLLINHQIETIKEQATEAGAEGEV